MLLIYDQDEKACDCSEIGQSLSDILPTSTVEIKIIDFAHTVIRESTVPDVGFLLGIHNLIAILEGLLYENVGDYFGGVTKPIILDAGAPIKEEILLHKLLPISK